VKLVLVQSDICSFEVIQRVRRYSFLVEEELLCKTRSYGGSIVLHCHFFSFKLIAHFELSKEGGIVKSYTTILGKYCVSIVKFIIGCFGVLPKNKNYLFLFYKGGLLCVKN
jgi:hypothetical protein